MEIEQIIEKRKLGCFLFVLVTLMYVLKKRLYKTIKFIESHHYTGVNNKICLRIVRNKQRETITEPLQRYKCLKKLTR